MPPGPVPDFPTPEEVRAIADRSDGVHRNLWITWSYHRLNRAMHAIVGDRDVSWCGFATWASKTAGTFIRQEELGPLVERWVQGATRRAGPLAMFMARRLHLHHDDPEGEAANAPPFSLRAFVREVVAGVGEGIAAGNQDVFRHIAPPFAQALTLWGRHHGNVPDPARQAFLDALHDGGDLGHYLRRAFSAMFDAAKASDPRARAQLMLQANALIGCAEQTRVQPFIERSLNYPVEELFHARLRAHLQTRLARPLAWTLQALLRPLGHALELEFDRLSTEWIMTLRLPGEVLRLGVDVPCLPDGRMYPALLETLDNPVPLELLEQLQATDAMGSAARDWALYTDRMRYIAVLFRSRQQVQDLWRAPFTEAQVGDLREGRVPMGPL